MRITILGKRWRLRFVPYIGPYNGHCDPPSKPAKEIRIAAGLKDLELLETLLHEMIHAGAWQFDEETVAGLSADIAVVLWRLGYRKEKK